jgi:hypothetical protein
MKNLLKKSKLKIFKDSRGKLFFYQKDNFLVKRIFFIEGKKNQLRGNHAHKKTKQVLININSNAVVEIIGKNSKKIEFSKTGDIIEIPKLNWVKINFIKKGYIAVVCDQKYLKNDYIDNFEKFKKKLSLQNR